MIKTAKALCLSLLLLSGLAEGSTLFHQGWYLGLLGGYGSTNWNKIGTSDTTLQTSLPSGSNDTGLTLGAFIGYDIGRHFGVEFRYQHFSNSKISFGQYNEYAPPPYDAFTMTSQTQSIMLLGKLRAQLFRKWELYSIMGGAFTLRKDQLGDPNGFGGIFGGGTAIHFSKYWQSSLEFYFVTGDATIDLEPARNYLPFLTALSFKISYLFS